MKSIPVTLQTHKELSSTTLCRLVKLRLRSGLVIGFTSLDTSVVYDDNPLDTAGDGPISYDAATGFSPSTIESSTDLSVDNAEITGLIPHYEMGQITNAMIRAGELDYAEWVEYEVNYRDLTMGHEIIGSGRTGEVSTHDQLGFIIEKRALSQQLKQTVVELDSITCRAIHGSMPIGTPGAEIVERFPCGFDVSTLWVAGVVDSVGAETDRTFTDGALDASSPSPYGTDYFVPGLVRWDNGNNAGRENEVEAFASGGVVTLAFPTDYPIQVGDTFQIRKACNKRWDDAAHGCLAFHGVDRTLHFRGEPHIPVGDEGSLSIPGAGL